MLRVTAIGAGSVEYLIRGCGCAEHDHAPEVDEGLELGEEVEHRHRHDESHGAAHAQREQTGADYLNRGAEHEPAGMWWGEGLDMVARESGTRATASDVRAVFGELRHPASSPREPEFLGAKPRVFRSAQERIKAALEAEPDASEERMWQIRNQIGGDQRKAVAYYDLTFSAPKSVSVYYAALLEAGREADAQRVWEMHQAAVDEAMEFVQVEAAYVRSGYHGKTRDGRSVGKHEEATGLVGIRFDHRTSRAQEPQIHSHFAVLNRATTSSDGKVRALDGRGFAPIKQGADAIYLNGLERRLTEALPVVFALRPDGVAREIMGIDQRLLAEASTRRGQVVERAAQLAADYRAREGRDPGPAAMKRIHQEAALATRAAKSSVAPGRQISAWSTAKRVQVLAALRNTADRARDALRQGHPDQRNPEQLRREEILVAAVAATQARYSTWTIGNLIAEVHRYQTDAHERGALDALAREALDDPARYGLALVSAPDPGPVPVELRRRDGRSRYRAHNEERYATAEQLAVETGIVATARQTDAVALRGPRLAAARADLLARGLGHDQLAAALGVLGSGRRGDALIGPAGVGKSRTVAGLSSVWQEHVGGRVMALATSQKATDVLGRELGMSALNTSEFLARFSPDAEGRARDVVRPGDLYVLDEAGMTSTDHWRRIVEIVTAGGGKLLFTGDPEQLAAVGAGGMLTLLVRDNGAHHLVEVHRFVQAWEKQASVGLRAGDMSALATYHAHGRLRGGTAEEVGQAAVRGYLADVLAGKTSAIVVASNADARELSAEVRSELVRLGKVAPEVLGTLRDGNTVGVGDLVQARRNDPDLRVDGPGMVTNRETYTVLSADGRGGLRVRTATGAVAHLSADYVRDHLTLAYAATVHAVQGATLDTCHALVSPRSRLESLYVAMTRGRETNIAYVVTQSDPDHHEVTRLDETPVSALEKIIRRAAADDDRGVEGVSAELARRIGEESGASLAAVGTEWDLLTTEAGQQRYIEQLVELLGDVGARRVVAEPGFNQLTHALRASDLAGHDTRAALVEAIAQRSLADVDSLSDVLRWRINHNRNQRVPEREVRAGDWGSLTPAIDGPAGQYARVLAAAATARQAEMGAAAWAEPPAWAVHLIGAPPTADQVTGAQLQAQEWIQRAGVVAAYRDLASVPEDSLSLGPAPAGEQVFHRALWEQAFTAAGCPAEDLDYRMAGDTELFGMRQRWEREQQWAPYFVADELAQARQVADTSRQDAQLWRAEAELYPIGSPQRAEAEADVLVAEQVARNSEALAEHLQTIHDARRGWSASAEHGRLVYEKAGEELARRGLDRDRTRPQAEQLELIEAVDAPQASAGAHRDADQLRLEIGSGEVAQERKDASVTVIRVPQVEQDRLGGELEEPAAPLQEEALFTAEPTAADLVAAQPLRPGAPGDAGPGTARAVTVGEAVRQAELSTALRGQRLLNTTEVEEWGLDADEREAQSLADRIRQGRPDELDPNLEQSLSAREDGQDRSLGMRI